MYKVDKAGNVVFTFSDEIEKNSNIAGEFSIKSQLNRRKPIFSRLFTTY